MSAEQFVPLVLALLCIATLWVATRLLAPSLQQGRLAENYRGKTVFLGLGVTWLLWSGLAMLAARAGEQAQSFSALLTLAGPLALVAFALGIVDDSYGTGSDRGFKGHLRALLKGRLTTGGLKLLGISVASYVVAAIAAEVAAWRMTTVPARMAVALLAGAAIALTANFVNLTDLRPGRALKVYSALAIVGSIGAVYGVRPSVDSMSPATLVLDHAALALFVLAPVFAVWRYDLGERGMLGDAGANAMGAVAGLLIVYGLPLWALAGYALVVFALNLASERFSFSRIIEATPILRRIDEAGRTP